MLPVLCLVNDGHATIPQCIPFLVEQFKLDEAEAEQLLASGKQTVLTNRAHWARNYLSQAGLVEQIKRGHYRISNDGLALLKTNPTEISKKSLEVYSKFQDFLARSGSTNSNKAIENTQLGESQETPEDSMERLTEQIDTVLRGELIEAILGLSPSRFEQLIVDLLVAMGYGGGDAAMGQAIGKSGDGGIDGIINEDALGLDAVYVQAKRYAVDSKVGRPAIQAFVGSLTGESATKGVFVTTSDFSREAREYVDRVQQRIVLINGDRLARLMIRYEVGVRARHTYVVRSVDEDYFTDASL